MDIPEILKDFFPFCKKGLMVLFCLFLSGSPAGIFLQAEAPDLAAGDSAFAAKDYAVAASFYTRYLNKLKKSPPEEFSKTKLRDAYERLMDSLLFANLTSSGEKYLAEYKKYFPDANIVSVNMWQGELFLQKGLLEKALPLYEKILSTLHGRDPRRLRALSAYARTLETLFRYKEASKAYSLLREQAGDSSMGKIAYVKEILTKIHAKDFAGAGKLIAEIKTPDYKENTKLLLEMYLLLQKEGISSASAEKLWKKILLLYGKNGKTEEKTAQKSVSHLPLPESRKEPLLYLVASACGDAFAVRKEYFSAAEAYTLAYQAAANNKELFQTLSRLIRITELSGDGQKAADLAQKQVEFFRHTLVDAAAKLRIGGILAKNGRNAFACKLYESVFHDLNATRKQKEESCEKYLLLMMQSGRTSDGITMLRSVFKKGGEQGRGEMLIADTLAKGGAWKESINVYDRLGGAFPAMASEAFYKALRIALSQRETEMVQYLYEKLRSGKPSDAAIRRELPFAEGAKNMLEGKNEQAEKLFAKYIQTKPAALLKDLPAALSCYSVLLLEKKEYKKALPYLQQLVQDFPGYKDAALAAYWILHIFLMEKDLSSAEKAATFLMEKYPLSPLVPDGILQFCRSLTEAGNYEKTSAFLLRLQKLPSAEKAGKQLEAKILYEKGNMAYRQKRKEMAISFLQRAVKKVPQGAFYQAAGSKLAAILYEMGKVEEAIDTYTKVSIAAGSDPLLTFAAQGALGNILLSSRSQDKESLKQALACFLAISAESSAPAVFRAEATYKAGRCHELLGEKQEGENLYKQLLYAFPPKQIMKDPAVSVWCVKAAECLIDSAAKTPVLSAFENARNALHYLLDAGLISRKDAQSRFENLKKMKFNP